MASIVGSAQQTTVSLASEGTQRQVRLTRDGAVITMDWIDAAIVQGICHGAQTGTGTTPDTLNPVYGDALQDFYLYVPAGTVIRPLYIGVALEDTGSILAVDTLAAYSTNGDANPTGTGLTVYNYKTLASPATSCVATAVVTSTGTTHLGGTDFLEFWRPYAGLINDNGGSALAVNNDGESGPGGAHWSAKDYPSPVIGSAGTDCALSIFAGAQAGIGFITVVWAEYSAAQFA